MVRKHLREEHLLNKKNFGTFDNNFYSIDEKGERWDYIKNVKSKSKGGNK
jgi:hypothetical protein